ncbi:Clu domain-containing protein [Entamoeba marina]
MTSSPHLSVSQSYIDMLNISYTNDGNFKLMMQHEVDMSFAPSTPPDVSDIFCPPSKKSLKIAQSTFNALASPHDVTEYNDNYNESNDMTGKYDYCSGQYNYRKQVYDDLFQMDDDSLDSTEINLFKQQKQTEIVNHSLLKYITNADTSTNGLNENSRPHSRNVPPLTIPQHPIDSMTLQLPLNNSHNPHSPKILTEPHHILKTPIKQEIQQTDSLHNSSKILNNTNNDFIEPNNTLFERPQTTRESLGYKSFEIERPKHSFSPTLNEYSSLTNPLPDIFVSTPHRSTMKFDKRSGEHQIGKPLLFNPCEKPFEKQQSVFGRALNWNDRYQEILSEEESLEKYDALVRFANNFLSTVETYGKIIISEMFLPIDQKTIKPVTLGGVAGGEKYVVKGIFFKLARNKYNLYKSDEYAAKVAGHELKGLESFYNAQVPGIHLPLAAVIDYRGYRLFAISVLPIKSNTIIYGSGDAGKTIRMDNPLLNEKMRVAAKLLNIKGHVIKGKMVHGPVDIEVHKGFDGRFYLCDCARVFPCEAPNFIREETPDKSSYLYRLFRPEFVRLYNKPLSSDAFSPFDKDDPMKETNRIEIIEATNYLYNTIIPEFVSDVERKKPYTKKDFFLTRLMHQYGINVRHLLCIYQLATQDFLRELILTEVMARVIKLFLKESQRTVLKKEPNVCLSDEFRKEALIFFNTFIKLYLDETVDYNSPFWKSFQKKFREVFVLPYGEYPTLDDFQSANNLQLLFHRIQKMTGIVFSDKSILQLCKSKTFIFVEADILKVKARVKYLNVVNLSEGNLNLMRCIRMKNEKDARRLLNLSKDKFELAVNTSVDEMSTLYFWCALLYQGAKESISQHDSIPLLELAYSKIRESFYMDQSRTIENFKVYVLWGKISSLLAVVLQDKYDGKQLKKSNDDCKLCLDYEHYFDEAAEIYLKSLSVRKDALDDLIENAMIKHRVELVALIRTCLKKPILKELLISKCNVGQVIALEHSYGVTDDVVKFIVEYNQLPLIGILLNEARFITDEALVSILKYHDTSLITLEIGECPQLTSEAIIKLCMNSKKMVWLFITKYYTNISTYLHKQSSHINVLCRHLDKFDVIPIKRKIVYFVTRVNNKFSNINEIIPLWDVRHSTLEYPKQPVTQSLHQSMVERVKYCYQHLQKPCFVEKGELVVGDRHITGTDFDLVGPEKYSQEYAGEVCIVYYTVAYTEDGINVKTYRNKYEVVIVTPPRCKEKGFGWDSILIPSHYYNTLSELTNCRYILNNRYRHFIQMAFSNS